MIGNGGVGGGAGPPRPALAAALAGSCSANPGRQGPSRRAPPRRADAESPNFVPKWAILCLLAPLTGPRSKHPCPRRPRRRR
ncbi:hypothetical protein DSI48_07795 [Mycobacterium tuberculosis]|nr:hypothetical protein BWP09_18645 [Mycobacterium tuberculosis]OOD67574.1 hypothetical protein BWP22_14620 [Mycobacterium tuberculosis]OOD74545.1 hypothetical protein BWP12_17215 [Mycobacterium tuberculosis]OOD79734.1 hypothetical protein BWP15_13080 [Mycobacterium tuberculosis]OOL02201.1 hypothetical protein Mtub8_17320 [Mycobacterium tuberculosis]